jgi:hypothetical protein
VSDSAAAAMGHEDEPGELVRIWNEDEVLEFSGRLIATATTKQPGKPRWLEMKLHRLTDGTGRYVISRVGRSVVYHRYDGPCNRGVPAPASELVLESVPCAACAAPALDVAKMMAGVPVAKEADHYSATVCDDAQHVLQRLRFNAASSFRDDALPAEITYSAPAQRLLDEARLRDEVMHATLSTVRRL